jgi:hypothetical protein
MTHCEEADRVGDRRGQFFGLAHDVLDVQAVLANHLGDHGVFLIEPRRYFWIVVCHD